MQDHVLSLFQKSFNDASISNGAVIREAQDVLIGFKSYTQGLVMDSPILVNYPDRPDRAPQFFRKIDFNNSRFILSIQDYLIDTGRAIIEVAPERGITTAVNQIFNKGVRELIDLGYLPTEDFNVANNNKRVSSSFGEMLSAKTESKVVYLHARFVRGM